MVAVLSLCLAWTGIVLVNIQTASGQLNGEVLENGNCDPFVSWPVYKGGALFEPNWHNLSFGQHVLRYTPMANPTIDDTGEYAWQNAAITLQCDQWVKYDNYGHMLYVNPRETKISEEGEVFKIVKCGPNGGETAIAEWGTPSVRASRGGPFQRINAENTICSEDPPGDDGSNSGGGGGGGSSGVKYCLTIDHYEFDPNHNTVEYMYSTQSCWIAAQ